MYVPRLRTQRQLYVTIGVSAAVFYAAFVAAMASGAPFAALAMVLVSSPLNMWYYARTYEKRSLRELFDLRRGSWAFIVGDTVLLPGAAFTIAAAWRDNPPEGWVAAPWMLLAAAGGVLAGVVFHKLDAKRYVEHGAAIALSSPTKLAHDFVAYPVLFGGLVCAGLPVMLQQGVAGSWQVIAWIAAWVVCGVIDVKRDIDPNCSHPLWDVPHFRLLLSAN